MYGKIYSYILLHYIIYLLNTIRRLNQINIMINIFMCPSIKTEKGKGVGGPAWKFDGLY